DGADHRGGRQLRRDGEQPPLSSRDDARKAGRDSARGGRTAMGPQDRRRLFRSSRGHPQDLLQLLTGRGEHPERFAAGGGSSSAVGGPPADDRRDQRGASARRGDVGAEMTNDEARMTNTTVDSRQLFSPPAVTATVHCQLINSPFGLRHSFVILVSSF